MPFNREFLRNPESFAAKHALFPYTPVNVDDVALYGSKEERVDKYSVHRDPTPKANFWCDIRSSSALPIHHELRPDSHRHHQDPRSQTNFYVMWITADQTSDTSFPVYYLPWRKWSALRMRLPNDTGETATPDRPHIFITAALQGCGVFADGPADSPMIYHLNMPRPDDMTRLHAELEEKYTSDYGSRRQFHTSALPANYAPLANAEEELSTEQELAWLNPKKLVFPRWDIQTAQRGTVFGHWEDGVWWLYRQTRTFVAYKTYNWPSLKVPSFSLWPSPLKWEETTVRQWQVTRCHQFWPVYRACTGG